MHSILSISRLAKTQFRIEIDSLQNLASSLAAHLSSQSVNTHNNNCLLQCHCPLKSGDICWYTGAGRVLETPCRSSLPIVLNDCCKAIYFNSRPFAHILQGAPFDQAKQDVKQATASLHRCNLRWSNQQSSQACSMLIAPPWLHLSHHLKARPVLRSKYSNWKRGQISGDFFELSIVVTAALVWFPSGSGNLTTAAPTCPDQMSKALQQWLPERWISQTRPNSDTTWCTQLGTQIQQEEDCNFVTES